MKIRYLLLLAGKDTIVDNAAARDFHKNSSSPDSKKTMKQYLPAFHQLWKEPQYNQRAYTDGYEFITKTLNDAKANVNEDLNWTQIKAFNVGRPRNARNPPVKRAILGILAIAYAIFGFALFIGVKIFSSRPQAYRFARLVF